MKTPFRDTLFVRLFALLWVALAASHTLGHATVDWLGWLPGFGPGWERRAPPPDGAPRPPFDPTEPPGFGGPRPPGFDDPRAPGGEHPRPPGGERPRPPGFDAPGSPIEAAPPVDRPRPPKHARPGPPLRALLLDLLVRALVITLAAWLGARWLVQPIRRFAAAADALGRSLEAPPIDAQRGPAEVRQAAQVFNAMRDRLREQFAERGRFLAAVSHDLRTPLTRIRLRLENLPDDPNVQRCGRDVAEMDQMIDAVLGYLREDADGEPPQQLDVFALAEALVDDLADLGKPASIRGESAVTVAQPAAMRRCLSNLIDNALRYGKRVEVTVQRQAGWIVIDIDDDGPGIAPDRRKAVLEPFVRLDPSRNRDTGGAGLGLYIAREIARRNGGTLTLGDAPIGGLRATMRLPAIDGERAKVKRQG